MLRDLFSLFPAYAGVILNEMWNFGEYKSFPRIRGGDPDLKGEDWKEYIFSPHTRG